MKLFLLIITCAHLDMYDLLRCMCA